MTRSYLWVGVVAALILASISLGLAIFTLSSITRPPTSNQVSVEILKSQGKCGVSAAELSLMAFNGDYALVRFREPATVPCFQHVIAGVEYSPGKVRITLKLQRTSEICVQCVGVIETELRIGPVAPGTEITVNNMSIKV